MVLAMVMVGLVAAIGFGRPSSTDAAWFGDSKGHGTFQAGSIPDLNVKCTTKNTPLTTTVTLTWDPPEGLEKQDVRYDVRREGSGVLAGMDKTTETSNHSYTYTLGPVSGLLQFGIDFTVTPKLLGTQWTGQSTPIETKRVWIVWGLGGLTC